MFFRCDRKTCATLIKCEVFRYRKVVIFGNLEFVVKRPPIGPRWRQPEITRSRWDSVSKAPHTLLPNHAHAGERGCWCASNPLLLTVSRSCGIHTDVPFPPSALQALHRYTDADRLAYTKSRPPVDRLSKRRMPSNASMNNR